MYIRPCTCTMYIAEPTQRRKRRRCCRQIWWAPTQWKRRAHIHASAHSRHTHTRTHHHHQTYTFLWNSNGCASGVAFDGTTNMMPSMQYTDNDNDERYTMPFVGRGRRKTHTRIDYTNETSGTRPTNGEGEMLCVEETTKPAWPLYFTISNIQTRSDNRQCIVVSVSFNTHTMWANESNNIVRSDTLSTRNRSCWKWEKKKKHLCEIYSRPTHKCQRHSFLYALPFVVVVVSLLDDSYFFFFFFPFFSVSSVTFRLSFYMQRMNIRLVCIYTSKTTRIHKYETHAMNSSAYSFHSTSTHNTEIPYTIVQYTAVRYNGVPFRKYKNIHSTHI